jgi:hypothetical protein
MKKYYLLRPVLAICLFVLIACFRISLLKCPAGIGNKLGFLLQNNYFIPRESNVCVFETTMQGEGSGGGWMYGEDDKYYYAVNDKYESKKDPLYFIFRKGQESQNFDKLNHTTWDKREGARWLPEKLRWDSYYDEGYER